MGIVLFKVFVPVLLALPGLWLLTRRQLETWTERDFLIRTVVLQIVPAVVLFVGLYVIGHQEVTSDVPNFYMPPAKLTLSGQIPLRDFPSSYAPLFPFFGAALLWIWNSGKIFVLFDIVLNALSLLLWHSVATRQFDRRTARASTVLFASSGN